MQDTGVNEAPVLNVGMEMQAFKDSLGDQRVSLEDLAEAETAIVAFCQRERFPNEIVALTSSHPEIPSSSNIYKLDPALEDGLCMLEAGCVKRLFPRT